MKHEHEQCWLDTMGAEDGKSARAHTRESTFCADSGLVAAGTADMAKARDRAGQISGGGKTARAMVRK